MEKSVVKPLWRSFIVFTLFVGFTWVKRDSLFQLGSEALDQSQIVLSYVFQIGIWLSAAHFFNRVVVVFIWDRLLPQIIGTPLPRLIKDIFAIIVYAIAITGIVGFVFDESVAGFWTTTGAVGLILGFALKNVVLDVFTGIAINIDRPFKIGDWIKVHAGQNVVGRISEINWRTTTLETEDDSVVILPNSLLGTMVVTNLWGGGEGSRFETVFCLDFSVPTDKAYRVLKAGAKAVVGQKGILEEPEPNVIMSSTTAVGVEYKIRFWMSSWGPGIQFGGARSLINTSVLQQLKQAGITPAYPKQDLYYAEMATGQLDVNSVADRAELLSETELFKHLDKRELGTLASSMELKRFKNGERLITQGEDGDSMFVLAEGLLHAYLDTNGAVSQIKVGQIVPGEFFGEMSLLTGAPRSATIVAATDIVAHEITKNHMSALLKNRPALVETISAVVAERRVRNSDKMAAATPEERIEETQSLARQIMTKMKAFFRGVF